ncbi:MAG: hypothetical protein JSW39_03945 [Desulfobacterales bacterium]|nr:MAG: hypothetical protein JSW39_03945 [Desulfobacterales bacterium]
MKQSTKGALLSALVYPGLGQLVLGRIFAGAVFIVLTTAGFAIIIYRITQRVYAAIEQILPMLAHDASDMGRLVEVLRRSSEDSWSLESYSLILVCGCWVVSIGHAYFWGRQLDRQTL